MLKMHNEHTRGAALSGNSDGDIIYCRESLAPSAFADNDSEMAPNLMMNALLKKHDRTQDEIL